MKASWLFSRELDLAAFGGSALLSFVALAAGGALGLLSGDTTPGWAWVPAVILCDVAHVWSTAFRTYLDPEERAARARLLLAVPALGLAASVALHLVGELTFWRTLAYVAIFHFVRQQYGWIALYRARNGERDAVGRLVDGAAIYASTLYPLFYWHTHARRFAWFFPGDVVHVSSTLAPVAKAAWALALGVYALRSIASWTVVRRAHRDGRAEALPAFLRGARPNPGKDLVVVTTAACWYVGIVTFDSDYAFTVTNVFIHGVPYFVLVRAYARQRVERAPQVVAGTALDRLTRHAAVFVGLLWAVAFAEELVWDRAVWHDHAWLFGESWDLDALKPFVVPLLALPQLTHYLLDGVLWRRRANPSVARLVAVSAPR
ncbi:MAG: hypothetical protein KC657_06210 [Myxococcales bacterium]|nr:hypothetical protein [Myxococcales bacterium]